MQITIQYRAADGQIKTDIHAVKNAKYDTNTGVQAIHELTKLVTTNKMSKSKLLKAHIDFDYGNLAADDGLVTV